MIWVVDASVALRWFMKNENHPNADAILERVICNRTILPYRKLFCFEVYAALCRLHPSGHEVFVNGMIPILHSGISDTR